MSKRKTITVTNSELSTIINALDLYIKKTKQNACSEEFALHNGRQASDVEAMEQYRAERLKERL